MIICRTRLLNDINQEKKKKKNSHFDTKYEKEKSTILYLY